MQNTDMPSPDKQMSEPVTDRKWHWILFGVVILFLAGFFITWYYVRQMNFNVGINNNRTTTPEQQEAREDINISNELEGIDVGNLDIEFQSIDSDLNSL